MRKRDVEMELLREREKALGPNLASVKKEWAGIKDENVCQRWSRANIDKLLETLENILVRSSRRWLNRSRLAWRKLQDW